MHSCRSDSHVMLPSGTGSAPVTRWERVFVMTPVDELVSLFAIKLRMEGWLVEPVAEGSRELLVEYGVDRMSLVLPESALATLLSDGDELARDLWGPSVSAVEAAARMMTVHLQESLDTSARDDLSGTWTYRGGFFTR